MLADHTIHCAMRYQGKIASWNSSRAFGFILWNGGSDRIFVHISAFTQKGRTPVVGDIVTYTVGRDAQGRQRAEGVDFVTPASATQAPQPPRAGHARHSARGKRATGRFAPALLVVALIAGYQWWGTPGRSGGVSGTGLAASSVTDGESDRRLQAAFANRRSNLQIEGAGIVSKVLPDDLDGSAHQRFILTLASGQTLLVAHNIDLAPRIPSLREGDRVRFFGEYEWNDRGGVIHWTHHDPGGRHVGGWLEHDGQRYQ